MKQYIKNGNFYDGYAIKTDDGTWISNPTEDILLLNGYIEYIEPELQELELTDVQRLELAKNSTIRQIEEYDQSSAVNNFVVNDSFNIWLTPVERTNYKNSIEAAKLLGITTVSFYLDTLFVTLPVEEAERMLASILLYADSCFITTKRHILTVKRLTQLEDVVNYDYTQGYPEQLHFNISY